MKFKSLALLIGIFSLSSCGAFDDFTYSGIFDDQEAIGRDALFSDTTFESNSLFRFLTTPKLLTIVSMQR